ncbi:hypothetical protein D3C80_1856430 [compost metagenome]
MLQHLAKILPCEGALHGERAQRDVGDPVSREPLARRQGIGAQGRERRIHVWGQLRRNELGVTGHRHHWRLCRTEAFGQV